jgi:hypothetical protein
MDCWRVERIHPRVDWAWLIVRNGAKADWSARRRRQNR